MFNLIYPVGTFDKLKPNWISWYDLHEFYERRRVQWGGESRYGSCHRDQTRKAVETEDGRGGGVCGGVRNQLVKVENEMNERKISRFQLVERVGEGKSDDKKCTQCI